MKEYQNLPLYDLTETQKSIQNMDYGFHQNTIQIPTYIIIDHPIDPLLMKQAVNEEIRRNDCFRNRFVKIKGKWKQYFLPSGLECEDIPLDDYRGKTQEEMYAELNQKAQESLNYKKNNIFHFRFFLTPDQRFGIFLNISHLVCDLVGLTVMYQDLIKVYRAFDEKTDLPLPLGLCEENIRSELEMEHNEEGKQRLLKKAEKYLNSQPIGFYSGADYMRQLKKERKFLHKPDFRFSFVVDPFHDRSQILVLPLEQEFVERVKNFVDSLGVFFPNVIDLAYRLHLSAANERSDNVTITMIVNRRTALKDRHHSAVRMHAIPIQTIWMGNETFSDALKDLAKRQMKMMRFSECSYNDLVAIVDKREHHSSAFRTMTMIFSVLLPEMVSFEEDWKIEFSGLNPGSYATTLYTMVAPDPKNGGMVARYLYRDYYVKEEELRMMHQNMIKVLEMGMANPDITIGQIMDSL